MRVLLVDGDLCSAGGLSKILHKVGAVIDQTDLGEEALEMIRHYDYDIVVSDLMLPDMDGAEMIRRMRSARVDVPVLALSGESASARLRAFAAGADDVLAKPYDEAELVARLQAILRRSKGYASPIVRVGNLQLNLDSRSVKVDEQILHLTGKEYAILELLVLRKGMVLTKDAFLNHLYGGMDEPEIKIIDVFICKLRKKLQGAGAGNLISTVWGRGYMLREEADIRAPMHRAAPSGILPGAIIASLDIMTAA
ncbi:response regulator transcription factor [Rhizosaccharibacter radicis]|uniref:Response regulator transcription factor n=1 Tax=Rhizosaccharibacter radicis TaxID=2782605 RepID=A0ABT1VSC1_9PROT|nr:response regulator transcription factor [Acetobacteraceae bacterium KSS12]